MVKISALMVLKHGGEGSDCVILDKAKDLCGYGVSRRSRLIDLAGRTFAKQTPPGQRQCVRHKEYWVYSYTQDGLCVVAFTDADYPARSALLLLNKTLDEYQDKFGDSWKIVESDIDQEWPYLNEALIKYQDPAEIDKPLKLHKTSELWAAPEMYSKRPRKPRCCFSILLKLHSATGSSQHLC